MYIINAPTSLSFSKVYKCGESRGKYLMEKCNFPLLSIDEDGKYVFAHTDVLEKALKDMSVINKIFTN